MTPQIKRELRRRSAVEPVIGHLKAEHRMGRNYLWFRQGDAANAVLAAAGYNFRRLIRWLRILLCLFLPALFPGVRVNPARDQRSSRTTNSHKPGKRRPLALQFDSSARRRFVSGCTCREPAVGILLHFHNRDLSLAGSERRAYPLVNTKEYQRPLCRHQVPAIIASSGS